MINQAKLEVQRTNNINRLQENLLRLNNFREASEDKARMDAKMALRQDFMEANKKQLELAQEKMNSTNKANKMLQSHTNGKWGVDDMLSDSVSRGSGCNSSGGAGSSITAKRMTTHR